MSNAEAIAATTETLRVLLGKAAGNVTARPPDKARDSGDQLNLFLYHAEIDGAWRNQDMPGVKPGETGRPPLPLNLFYLLTAFSNDPEDSRSHALLGRAMRVLHDHPVLSADDIRSGSWPGSDLEDQIERVRITFQPLSVDEMYKLWGAFQTQYRTSVAYQVSVVLIESRRSSKTPLPVLRRGEDDRGVTSQPDLVPPFPALTELVLPGKQASALLGDEVILRGHHLDQGTLSVRFANPHLTVPVPVQIKAHTATEVTLKLLDTPDDPNAAQKWVAGFYTVALVLKDGDRERATNELPLAVAPRVTSAPGTVVRGAPPDLLAKITLQHSPEVRPAQRAALLLGDREVPANARPAQIDTLDFEILHAPLGKHFLRLRIDGVDSFLIDPAAQPPAFDLTKRVEIT